MRNEFEILAILRKRRAPTVTSFSEVPTAGCSTIESVSPSFRKNRLTTDGPSTVKAAQSSEVRDLVLRDLGSPQRTGSIYRRKASFNLRKSNACRRSKTSDVQSGGSSFMLVEDIPLFRSLPAIVDSGDSPSSHGLLGTRRLNSDSSIVPRCLGDSNPLGNQYCLT